MPALTAIGEKEWGLTEARHLLNRAGFGTPPVRAARMARMGPEAAVASLVDYDPHAAGAEKPGFVPAPLSRAELRAAIRELSDTERRKAFQERMREERRANEMLKSWWLERMHRTPNPLQEKMTLFWHGHFATSAQKVRSSYHNWHLNQCFRDHATGNVKALTFAVGQSPAMLRYLDNERSTWQKPNENWARELMELFTMGPGTYTEDDIKASARAFTGWTTGAGGFNYRLEWHDPGEKTFLGRRGAFDGWDIINIIFEQEATAAFLAAKLYRFFVKEDTDPVVVAEMAALLRENDYALRPVLKRLFLSRAFYAPEAVATQVKSPAQLVVHLADDMELEHPPYGAMALAARALGQDLFYPPNVKGWDGNRAWINANTALLRYNLPGALVLAASRRERRDGMGMQRRPVPERDRILREVRRKLHGRPPSRQGAALRVLREGSPEEKRALLERLGIAPPAAAGGEVLRVFDLLSFTDAAGCVDALARHFLATKPSEEQKAVLLRALGTNRPDNPLTAGEVPAETRRALLHLVTSMAEYQLC